MFFRIRNERKKQIRSTCREKNAADDDTIMGELNGQDLSDKKKQEYLSLLKTCILPQDIQKLKDVLKITIALREEMMKSCEFQQAFPFYFACTELVSDNYMRTKFVNAVM